MNHKYELKEILNEIIQKEIQIGIGVFNASHSIVYSNPFLKKILPPLSNIHEFHEILGNVTRTGKSTETIIKTEDNKTYKIRFIPYKKKKKLLLIGFFQDITEEKRVEEIKRDFVANVSHELRTPLASIKGYADTLLDGALNDRETARKFISIIQKHAVRMTALIEDLLTLSRLESADVKMTLEPVDIKVLIKNVVQGLEKSASDKNIKLIIAIEKNIPKIMADKTRLEQVLVNLLDNAIKYTNKGYVRVCARTENNSLVVNVEDTGIGIPAKDIPRIFERFYRVDKGRSRELGGTGLGLSIVKHIIQAHNGRVWVKSEVGKGSKFFFSIPLKSLKEAHS